MGVITQYFNAPDQETSDGNFSESTRVLDIPENSVGDVLLNVVAIGSNGARAAWNGSFVVNRAGGDVTVTPGLIDVLSVRKDVLAATWDVDLLVDGDDVIVRVKGAAGVTVYWAINGIVYGAIKP